MIDHLWQQTGGDDLLNNQSFQQLLNSLPDCQLAVATDPKSPTYLVCIDDRIPGLKSLPKANYVHYAGEGILSPAVFETAAQKIDGILPHSGCGAKALYCQINQIPTDDPDAPGFQAVEDLSKKTGKPIVGKISKSDLSPIHSARSVYYDNTGRFDPSKVTGLPPGFVISRNIISDLVYAQKEVDIAISIAFSDHGFGHKFSPKSPLFLVVVTNRRADLKRLKNELKTFAQKYNNVQIDSLIVK